MGGQTSQRNLFKRKMFNTDHHDRSGLLAPGEEPTDYARKRIFFTLALFVLVLICLLPSHQITSVQTVKFPFEMPTHVSEGGLMTFPMRDNDQIVRVGNLTPSKLVKQNMYMAGFGLKDAASVHIWSLSKPEYLGWFKRQWVSRPVEYSEHVLMVDRLPPRPPLWVHLPPIISKQLRKIASVEIQQEAILSDALLTRTDGAARLDCWQSPLPFSVSNDFGMTRVFDNGQTAIQEGFDIKANIGNALKASGAGEVVGVETSAIPGRVITIYHGDGLYTRYMHLREFQTHVGEKVATGQMIGFSGNSGRAESPYLRFEVIWRGKHLNPSEVLRVSQRFCEKTATPLVQTKDRADRSPASKIYRWMSRQNQEPRHY